MKSIFGTGPAYPSSRDPSALPCGTDLVAVIAGSQRKQRKQSSREKILKTTVILSITRSRIVTWFRIVIAGPKICTVYRMGTKTMSRDDVRDRDWSYPLMGATDHSCRQRGNGSRNVKGDTVRNPVVCT
jgi:hypothetical protein